MIKGFVRGSFLVIVLLYMVTCYAAGESQDPTSVDSENFRVSYKSNIVPLPLNSMHSWVLHVDTLAGQPVEKAVITVYGGMPAHRHGLPTQPGVTELGNGDYLVEGIKFSMIGMWEMWFSIQAEGVADKAKFIIHF
ncbi:MAG: Auxin-binding protein [Gammaproteobacteria bacterium]|nr:MAG: Auxin-binding protein [Gammaproteobacteria bacterium]